MKKYTTSGVEPQRHPTPFTKPGWALFPCLPGRKQPAIKNGLNDASDDPAQWAAWSQEFPGCNWAVNCGKSGLFVIDIDGQEGENAWAHLTLKHEFLASTLEVRTPRGGRHIYLIGDGKSTVQRLGEKVDTRGAGGYVLLPGSVVDGKPYVVANDVAPVTAPAWALEAAGATRDKVGGTGDLDQPQNVARARSYLANEEPAVEGFGGDHHTFVVACTVLDLGLSEEKAFELMQVWNARCDPPWEDDDLRLKVENAASYRQNGVGAFALEQSSQETFGALVAALLADERQGQPRRRPLRPIWPSEMRNLPKPEYLIDGVIPDLGVTVVYGPTGSFKSFVVLDLLVSVATGRHAFGHYRARSGDAVLYAGEAAGALAKQRFPACCTAKAVADIDAVRFAIVPTVPQVANAAQIDELITELRDGGVTPRIIALDTVARAMRGLNESEAKDAGMLFDAAERLRDEFGCAVILVHHSGKDTSRGARGSGVFENDADAVFRVDRVADSRDVKLVCLKMKDAEVPPDILLKGEDVGQSLVFKVTDADSFTSEAGDHRLQPGMVGKALKELGALERDGKSVTTDVLACHLAKTGLDQALIGAFKKALNRGATKGAKRLRSYVAFDAAHGQSRRWWFPHGVEAVS